MNPVLVAAAVLIRDGKVLLTQRPPKGHLASLWEFPGGKLERDESPEQAVVRECAEEIGVVVRPIDILDVTYHRYESKTVLLLFYECELVSGEVQNLQVAAHAWVDPSTLTEYPLPPADVNLVAKLQRRFAVP